MQKSIRGIFLALIIPVTLLAFPSSPPDGKTGAPGEGTCRDCHNQFQLNSGDGALELTGPDFWTPGEQYELTVTLSDPGQERWGFEVTQMGMGEFSLADASNTQMSMANGREYVKQTNAGTADGTNDGPVSWNINWTAPTGDELPEDITFYVCGNACNSGSGNQGDYVYTSSLTIAIDNTSIEDDLLLPQSIVVRNVPNPFNPSTDLLVDLPVGGEVKMDIYDVRGALVRSLLHSVLPAGLTRVTWDGQGNNGVSLSSGVYLAVISSGDFRATHRMLLIK